MEDTITTWTPGHFIDQTKYRNRTPEEKEKARKQERLLVRPDPQGKAICQCHDPETAEWIARRLNLAARLEKQMLDD